MREADIHEFGVPIGGRMVSNLRYADDTALIAGNGKSPNEMLRRVNEAGKKRLLKLNVKKTKSMTVGAAGDNIQTENENIDQATSFKYLGSIKTKNGDCTTDIKARIAMAKKRTLDLTPIWKDRGLRTEVKLNLMRALVWSVLTYGVEGWTLKKKAEKYIESAEMWIYRRILRISWTEKRTNSSVLEQLGIYVEIFLPL